MRALASIKALAAASLLAVGLVSVGASASAHVSKRSFTSSVFASGANITHSTPAGSEAISKPDDVTSLGNDIFVGFQNGIGPQGQASSTGNLDSTVVEFNHAGHELRQWDIVGKCDGLTADPASDQVVATVNEDANSSVYLISPTAGPVQYTYDKPLPSNGGTDAISIYHGMVLVSASAPGTSGAAAPQPDYPAVYRIVFHASTHVATIHPMFYVEAPARVANSGADHGRRIRLALTDPDSNEAVPAYGRRFAGEFMLTSQGDEEQIFLGHKADGRTRLDVLRLTASVDDTVWPADRSGAIYTTNNAADTIDMISGPFKRGLEYVAVTPCDESSAPSTCPAPGFPANYLGLLNPRTGSIAELDVHGAPIAPQGMLFLP